jgi:excisionase family DNA binding protein
MRESPQQATFGAAPGDYLGGDRLLSLREAAAFLQLHERTIRRWIVSKGFPCVRLGTRLRFSQRDILRWASARKEGW